MLVGVRVRPWGQLVELGADLRLHRQPDEPAVRDRLVILVGLVIVGVGVYHIHKGWKRKFLADLQEHPGEAVEKLARFGYIAKGVALIIVGGLFGIAALENDPEEATGLDGGPKTPPEAPAGQWLVTPVALGFIAFAIYSFVRAKKARILRVPQSRRAGASARPAGRRRRR